MLMCDDGLRWMFNGDGRGICMLMYDDGACGWAMMVISCMRVAMMDDERC